MGYGYYYGNGLEKNMEMAYKMFTKAALLAAELFLLRRIIISKYEKQMETILWKRGLRNQRKLWQIS